MSFTLFSPSSIWNRLIPPDAPIDPASPQIVANLAALAKRSGTINTTAYSIPIWIVGPDQKLVKVKLNKLGGERNPLQLAWNEGVPVPPDAVAAKGTDKSLVLIQPSTKRLWEFFQFEQPATGPQAVWGGAMQDYTTNPGAYDVGAWPQLVPSTSGWNSQIIEWGGSASSLSIAGGLITLADLEIGKIDHALSMAVPNGRAGVWCPPAQRTDGRLTTSTSIPLGAQFRLDPALDLSKLAMPRFTRLLAEAAQKRGIVVRDTSSAVPIYAEDPSKMSVDPYLGAKGYFGGLGPKALLAAFPWDHLQLLKMTLA